MADAVTTRGGKFRVLLGNDPDNPTEYATPCGFLSKSLTLSKGLEEVRIPKCDDPDAISWLGQDAVSMSMAISGDGMLAAQSVDAWIEAWEHPESWPVKVEIEFPAKTITWTGRMQVATLTMGHPTENGRVTNNVEMSSDGEMMRVTDANAAPTNTLLPSISGIAQQGEELTALNGTWTGWPTSYTYQWQQDDTGWENIPGATAKTFTPAVGHVGNQLRVIVTAINSAGSASATSAATAAVLAE